VFDNQPSNDSQSAFNVSPAKRRDYVQDRIVAIVAEGAILTTLNRNPNPFALSSGCLGCVDYSDRPTVLDCGTLAKVPFYRTLDIQVMKAFFPRIVQTAPRMSYHLAAYRI
jgi:hypothetical protein